MDAGNETVRVEAFSDGVFAFAITLLVLELKVPTDSPGSGGLLDTLFKQWPVFLAFLTSFATVGIMWMNHNKLFLQIKRIDHWLIVLNLLLLLTVTFVPFPTEVLAEYIEGPDQHIAAMIYSGAFLLIAICFNLLWRYASYKDRLLDEKADPEVTKRITRDYAFGPMLYIVALGLATINAGLSVALNLLLAVFFALPHRDALRRHDT
ncbi:MAG: TMEM175 family protein [Chloroflexia bacterium]